jgi:hypothetical protein
MTDMTDGVERFHGLCPNVDGEIAKSSHAAPYGLSEGSHSESGDDYPLVVAMLDANTRVIECANGIQWIIQRRCNAKRWPWRSLYFCRTKEGLLLYARPITSELLALPDRFPEAA